MDIVTHVGANSVGGDCLFIPSCPDSQNNHTEICINCNPVCPIAYMYYFFSFIFVCLFVFGFSRQGFSVSLKPVLKQALAEQTDLKLIEIYLPLSPKSWD